LSIVAATPIPAIAIEKTIIPTMNGAGLGVTRRSGMCEFAGTCAGGVHTGGGFHPGGVRGSMVRSARDSLVIRQYVHFV
jgi:hypothetical protein